ncbi:N-acetyltransferase B complex non catalytic subunit-domain-containing protein [Syncephalis plumigaleata]|nr:N-acetyltransferase B complex non catalytic subunit-domain-containing protein [Syncephalis plumigaleata]
MERRIGVIYDAIDERNYKLAIQHCNKLLKKYPSALQVTALKALALCRANKTTEALEQCAQVCAASPTDPAIMQPVSMVYRTLGLHDENARLYEAAFKAQPQNEELANLYFMSLARGDSFKAQHQLALRMHKTFKSSKYLFWAINCLVLQSKSATDAEKTLLLTLAERMMVKAVEDDKISQFEELLLYADVLVTQNKHKEALTLLEGKLADKLNDPFELNQLRMSLLVTLEQWEDVNAFCVKQLQEGSSDWKIYLTYIDTLKRIRKEKALEEAQQFIEERIKADKQSERSPYLALVQLQSKDNDSVDYKALQAAIIRFFKQFGGKPSCYTDLRQYLASWPDDMAKSLSNELHALVETFEGDARVVAQTNAQSLIYYMTSAKHASSASELVSAAMKKFEQHFANDGATSSAGLVYLAATELIQAYRQSNDINYLLVLAAALEAAREKDNLNFQYSLILCRVYSLLGCGARAIELYDTLSIKHVQNDTLSYLMTDVLFDLGLWEESEHILESAASIYTSNIFETPEMIVQAYKYATFSQITNFMEFRDRLDNSLQRELIQQEINRVGLLRSAKSTSTLLAFIASMDSNHINITDDKLSQLSDNRDYEPFPLLSYWDGPSLAELLLPCPLGTKTTISRKAWRLRAITALFDAKNNNNNLMDLLTQAKELNTNELADNVIHSFISMQQSLQQRISGDIDDSTFSDSISKLGTDLFSQIHVPSISDTDPFTFTYIQSLTTIIESVFYLAISVIALEKMIVDKSGKLRSTLLPRVTELKRKAKEIVNNLEKHLSAIALQSKRVQTVMAQHTQVVDLTAIETYQSAISMLRII